MRISHPQDEGILEAAKMLKVSLLVAPEELAELFNALGEFAFYNTASPTELKAAKVSTTTVLKLYGQYWDELAPGKKPDRKLTSSFALTLACSDDVFYAMPLGSDKFLIRQTQPCVQMQHHQFIISDVDGSFHSGVCAQDAISWGLTFIFPQVYKDIQTKQFVELTKQSLNAERQLFERLQYWVRHNTVPCKFEGYGTQTFRMGKKVQAYANHHHLDRIRNR